MTFSSDTNRPLSNYHNAIDDEETQNCIDCGEPLSYNMQTDENYCEGCEKTKQESFNENYGD